MSAIEIARQDLSISQLRRRRRGRLTQAGAADSGHCHGAGWSFAAVGAQASAMDRQTLRDWVHRYNADGLAGWRTGPGLASASSGRSPASEVASGGRRP